MIVKNRAKQAICEFENYQLSSLGRFIHINNDVLVFIVLQRR